MPNIFDLVKLINMGQQASEAVGTISKVMQVLGRSSRPDQQTPIQGLKQIKVKFSNSDSDIAKLYKIFCNNITRNQDFDDKYQKNIIFKDETTLWMVNATTLVTQKPKFNHLILSELADILLEYIHIKGGGSTKHIDKTKIFAVSLILTALTVIDRQIPAVDSDKLTMRYLLGQVNKTCEAFLRESPELKEARKSSKAVQCLHNFQTKISEHSKACLENDSKEILRHYSPICADQMETTTYLCAEQSWLLAFNNSGMTSLIADPKNKKALKTAKNYEDFKKLSESKEIETVGGLTTLVRNQNCFQFVQTFMFGIDLFDKGEKLPDEKTLRTKLADLKLKIVKELQDEHVQKMLNLPGDHGTQFYPKYLESIAEFIAATHLLNLLTREINKIRGATNTLGELASFLGNQSFIKTLELVKSLTASLPIYLTNIRDSGHKLAASGTFTKNTTESAWYKNLTALDSFVKRISEHTQGLTYNADQMLIALTADELQGKFTKILADLEHQLSKQPETKDAQETKEIKTEQPEGISTPRTISSGAVAIERPATPESQEVKETGTHIRYSSDIQLFLMHLSEEVKPAHCQAVWKTIENTKNIQVPKGLTGAVTSKISGSNLVKTALINPADYFKVTRYSKFAITGSLLRLISDYRFNKDNDLFRPSHESDGEINDPKVLLVGIVLTYIDDFERTIALGDNHTDTAHNILNELSAVIRAFFNVKEFSASSNPSQSCVALGRHLQDSLEGYFAKKALLDQQKIIYDNAKQLNNYLSTIFYDLAKGALEITTGQFVGDILAHPGKAALIADSNSYQAFLKNLKARSEIVGVASIISDEEMFKVIKYLSLNSSQTEQKQQSEVLTILIKRFENRFKSFLTGGEVFTQPDEKELRTAVINLLNGLSKLRQHIHQQSRLMSSLQDIGEIGVLLQADTRSSLSQINVTLQKIKSAFETIQEKGHIIFGRHKVEENSLGYFPQAEDLTLAHISQASIAANKIKTEIVPTKLAEKFGKALETIVSLKAFSEEDAPRIERALKLCQSIKDNPPEEDIIIEQDSDEKKSSPEPVRTRTVSSNSTVISLGGSSIVSAKIQALEENMKLITEKQTQITTLEREISAAKKAVDDRLKAEEHDYYETSIYADAKQHEVTQCEQDVENNRPWITNLTIAKLLSATWVEANEKLSTTKNELKKLQESLKEKKLSKNKVITEFKEFDKAEKICTIKKKIETLNKELLELTTSTETIAKELRDSSKPKESTPTTTPVEVKVSKAVQTDSLRVNLEAHASTLVVAIETAVQNASAAYSKEVKGDQAMVNARFGKAAAHFQEYKPGVMINPEENWLERLQSALLMAVATRKDIEAAEGHSFLGKETPKVQFRTHFNLEINRDKSALAALLGIAEKDITKDAEVRYKKPNVCLEVANQSFNLETIAETLQTAPSAQTSQSHQAVLQ